MFSEKETIGLNKHHGRTNDRGQNPRIIRTDPQHIRGRIFRLRGSSVALRHHQHGNRSVARFISHRSSKSPHYRADRQRGISIKRSGGTGHVRHVRRNERKTSHPMAIPTHLQIRL